MRTMLQRRGCREVSKAAVVLLHACSTFGIPGVEQHVHFLRDVANASAIRRDFIANWNLANLPSGSPSWRPCRRRSVPVMPNVRAPCLQLASPSSHTQQCAAQRCRP